MSCSSSTGVSGSFDIETLVTDISQSDLILACASILARSLAKVRVCNLRTNCKYMVQLKEDGDADKLLKQVVEGMILAKLAKSRVQALEYLTTIRVHDNENMFREFLKDISGYDKTLKDYLSVFGVGH